MKRMLYVAFVLLASVFCYSTSDSPFYIGIEMPTQIPIKPAVREAVKDMGINYINYVVLTNSKEALPSLDVNTAMLEFCDELNLSYAISTQCFDPCMESVTQAAAHGAKGDRPSRFLGVVHDEIEHYRVLTPYHPKLMIQNKEIEDILEAFDYTTKGLSDILKPILEAGAPAVKASQVWPVLFHAAAKAGYTVCPKLCKESYSPVSMSIALGAAIQYGRPLWADVDLWYYGAVPGHSAEEMKASLMFAYWMGVEGVYIEGAGHNLRPPGKQGLPFSLMTLVDDEHYQLTPHGEVLRWFCREYVPSHPRRWTFRDVKPDAAIIRYEDTCHGQRFTPHFEDMLYANPAWTSDRNTEAWLGLWNVLTHGSTGSDGLTYFKGTQGVAVGGRPYGGPLFLSVNSVPQDCSRHNFFVPLKGVVCFDHLVCYDHLKEIPVLYLTGLKISDPTWDAVKRCVDEGAMAVIWGPLAKDLGMEWNGKTEKIEQGKGAFVLVDDFQSRHVFEHIKLLVGLHNEISYRFKNSRLTLRRIDDNRFDVDIR